MTARWFRSPAHPRGGCAGVVFLLAVTLVGCGEAERPGEPVVLEIEGDTVRLAPGVRLIDVAVRAAATEFEPPTPSARVGDVVRFTGQDGGAHAIAFERAQLDATALEFLERTGQLRGPPLLHAGAAWIVSLTDAPPGEYPFRCLTHGASGSLTVAGN